MVLMSRAVPLVLLLGLLAPAAASASTDARLEGSFRLHGRVTQAVQVRGVKRGQSVVRTWRFDSTCATGPCPAVTLRRSRGRAVDVLTLRRRAPGVYSGTGSFTVPLRCGDRTYRRGGLVPFTITVRISSVVTVQSTPFAMGISASYVNRRRINRTPCPGSIGHDAVAYTGSRIGALPAPPSADFAAVAVTPSTLAFQDVSRRGASGAKVVAESWDFGDPASGAANTATGPRPTHSFSSPGAFTVTLTVRDGNGLVGAVQRAVTAG